MSELVLSAVEPFTSPAWGSNFVVFSGEAGPPIPEAQTEQYLRKCGLYAKRHEVWLVPERFVLAGEHCMALFTPEGEMPLMQKAIHNSPAFKSKAAANTDLEIFLTPMGKVMLCVDADIYRPEVACTGSKLGAQVIVCSQSIGLDDYGTHMVLTGAWNAAQQAGVYVIAVSNQFNCVCAPVELTPQGDGFLNPPGLKMPMTQRISPGILGTMRRHQALSRRFYYTHRQELIG